MRKTIYGLKDKNGYCTKCYESLTEAEETLKMCNEKDPMNQYSLERFIFKPKHCDHCNHFELLTIPEREPWMPVTYQCPQCDSTFVWSKP